MAAIEEENLNEKMNGHRYFELKLFIPNDIDSDIRELYVEAVKKHNDHVSKFLFNENAIRDYNCGFDLFVPKDMSITNKTLGYKIDNMIKCSMFKIPRVLKDPSILPQTIYKPVGYYLYPRSSTGTKTPLRLSNSVGIIDPGYRGNIISAFDNMDLNNGTYKITKGTRLVQLCPPDIGIPIMVNIVNKEEELGTSTLRGTGGFGYTGV